MGVNNYDITAAAFRRDKVNDYELSILAGVDSFAYILRDRIRNNLLAYRSYGFDPAERDDWEAAFNRLVQADDKLRSLRYGSVTMGWDTPAVALVPEPLFTEENRRDYLEQLTLVGLEDEVRAERYHDIGAYLVYSGRQRFPAVVERRLGVQRTQHYAGGLLTAWTTRARRIGHTSVSAAIRGKRFFVAVHRAGSLLFYNTFHFAGAEDALYYLLLTYQQNGLSPTRHPLYLCGEITQHSDLYRLFYRYVEDLRFCVYGAPPAIPPELASVPSHVYFELLCLG